MNSAELDDVGADRPERELLDIAGVHMRQMRPAIRKTIPVNTGSPVSQDERIGLWVTDKGQALEVHHLALVPADQGDGLSQARQLTMSRHDPHIEIILIRNRRDVADLRLPPGGKPCVGELKATSGRMQRLRARPKIVRRQLEDARPNHRAASARCVGWRACAMDWK